MNSELPLKPQLFTGSSQGVTEGFVSKYVVFVFSLTAAANYHKLGGLKTTHIYSFLNFIFITEIIIDVPFSPY